MWWEATGVPGLLPLTSGRLGHQLSGVGVEKGRQQKERMRRFCLGWTACPPKKHKPVWESDSLRSENMNVK